MRSPRGIELQTNDQYGSEYLSAAAAASPGGTPAFAKGSRKALHHRHDGEPSVDDGHVCESAAASGVPRQPRRKLRSYPPRAMDAEM